MLVHAPTPLGFALAKECVDVLDGMRVGVRVIGVLLHGSTPLGFALANESSDLLLKCTDLLVHGCARWHEGMG